MATIRINGECYTLRMSLWASEQIEKEFGGIQDGLKKFQKEKSIETVKKMFRILANAGRRYEKKPMDVTGDELDDCTVGDLDRIANAMKAAMDQSMHAETVGGNEADDEVADAYAAELEQQEKNV